MISFGILSLLLLAGVGLRRKVTLFRKLYLPASVIAGLIGLVVLQLPVWHRLSFQAEMTAGWSSLPGMLINIVFAALFLGHALPSARTLWHSSRRQLAYGQIVAWGQYLVGGLVVWLCLKPLFGVEDLFAGVMPVGFEGGHGTAGGLAPVFDQLGAPYIKDFALSAATFGILGAIIMGMAFIQWAARKGMVERRLGSDIFERTSAGTITISSDIVGALTYHLALVGLAVLVGHVFKWGLQQVADLLPDQAGGLFESFPLFPLCMLGGVVMRWVADKMGYAELISEGLMMRVQNVALDYLVVAAIATIQIEVVAAGWLPLLIIVLSGMLWNAAVLCWIAPRVFKDAWFERAIAEMGQSMGVTATGLLLLRTVDPDYETEAASAFASKQLLHEPFMGGGLWTGMAIPLLALWGVLPIVGIAAGVMILWTIMLLVTKT